MICGQKVLNLTVQSIHCPLDIYHQWNYGPPLIQKKLKIDLIGIIIDITIPKNNSIVHCKKEKWFFLLFLTRLDIKFFVHILMYSGIQLIPVSGDVQYLFVLRLYGHSVIAIWPISDRQWQNFPVNHLLLASDSRFANYKAYEEITLGF